MGNHLRGVLFFNFDLASFVHKQALVPVQCLDTKEALIYLMNKSAGVKTKYRLLMGPNSAFP